MAQELYNYINQARQAGKSDELIKQELRSSGWQEADISQAFGGNSVAINMAGNTIGVTSGPEGASWLTAKFIGGIILALVVIGGIAYVAFFRGSSGTNNPTQGTNNNKATTTQQNTSTKAPFSCQDLFTTNDFQKITRDSDPVKLHEPGLDSSAYSTNFLCSYSQGDITTSINVEVHNVLLSVQWAGTANNSLNAPAMYENFKTQMRANYETGVSRGIKGAIPPTDIAGIGSKAYTFSGGVFVLSSNQKYWFQVGKQGGIEMAKIVDANLNKY